MTNVRVVSAEGSSRPPRRYPMPRDFRLAWSRPIVDRARFEVLFDRPFVAHGGNMLSEVAATEPAPHDWTPWRAHSIGGAVILRGGDVPIAFRSGAICHLQPDFTLRDIWQTKKEVNDISVWNASLDRLLLSESHLTWDHAMVDIARGAFLWKRRAPWSIRFVADDRIIATTSDDPAELRVIDAETGRELWTARVGRGAWFVGVVGDLLWVHDTEAFLFALDLGTGRAVHRLAFPRFALPVLLDPEGNGHFLSGGVRYQIVDLVRGQIVRTMHFEKLDPIVHGVNPQILGEDGTLLFNDERTRLFRLDPAIPDPPALYHRLEVAWQTAPATVQVGTHRGSLFLCARSVDDNACILHCFRD